MTWQECRDKIRDISRLGANWDGRGANKPKPASLRRSLDLLDLLERLDGFEPTRIVATPCGSIVVEWQRKGEVRHIEVEVYDESGDTAVMYRFDDGTFEHGRL